MDVFDDFWVDRRRVAESRESTRCAARRGPWEVRRAQGFTMELYTVSRRVGRARVSAEVGLGGQPMLYGHAQALQLLDRLTPVGGDAQQD